MNDEKIDAYVDKVISEMYVITDDVDEYEKVLCAVMAGLETHWQDFNDCAL